MRDGWRQPGQVMIVLFVCCFIGLTSGCQVQQASSIYVNPDHHLSLSRPKNWKLAYYERSGQIILEAKTEVASSRVEILGGSGVPIVAEDTIEEVEKQIRRIRVFYNLDSVSVVQPPTKTVVQGREVVTAIIGLPVADLPDDAVINQVGGHEPGVIQTVDIRWITDSDNCTVLVFLYKGNDETLNAEAEAIVDSLQFSCPVEVATP